MYEWGGAQFYPNKEKNYNFMGKIEGKSIKLEKSFTCFAI